jgi:hypothetical protein
LFNLVDFGEPEAKEEEVVNVGNDIDVKVFVVVG